MSGIENHDYYNAVWYRRSATIPVEWAGKRVLLHFQAVDYDSTVWVNGEEVGRHRGGFSPFSCDISDVASAGEEITIVLRARDDGQKPQPRGKQARDYGPQGAIYVRTTGIWQSVWLEPVPDILYGGHASRPIWPIRHFVWSSLSAAMQKAYGYGLP